MKFQIWSGIIKEQFFYDSKGKEKAGADAPKICMVVFSGYIYQENKKSQNGDIN
jgi:hypothetical protein